MFSNIFEYFLSIFWRRLSKDMSKAEANKAGIGERPLINDPSSPLAEKTKMNEEISLEYLDTKNGSGKSNAWECFFRCLDRVLPKETLSDHLWRPLKLIANYPSQTFSWWLLINFIFLAFCEVNWAVAHAITVPGLVVLYVVCLHLVAQLITRVNNSDSNNSSSRLSATVLIVFECLWNDINFCVCV